MLHGRYRYHRNYLQKRSFHRVYPLNPTLGFVRTAMSKSDPVPSPTPGMGPAGDGGIVGEEIIGIHRAQLERFRQLEKNPRCQRQPTKSQSQIVTHLIVQQKVRHDITRAGRILRECGTSHSLMFNQHRVLASKSPRDILRVLQRGEGVDLFMERLISYRRARKIDQMGTDRVSDDQDTATQIITLESWQGFDRTNWPLGNRFPDGERPYQRI